MSCLGQSLLAVIGPTTSRRGQVLDMSFQRATQVRLPLISCRSHRCRQRPLAASQQRFDLLVVKILDLGGKEAGRSCTPPCGKGSDCAERPNLAELVNPRSLYPLSVENRTGFAGAVTVTGCPHDLKTASFFSVVFPETASNDAAAGRLLDF